MQERGRQRKESGATAAEYALLVAAIAAVIVLIIFAVGVFVGDMFNDTCTAMDAQSSISGAANC